MCYKRVIPWYFRHNCQNIINTFLLYNVQWILHQGLSPPTPWKFWKLFSTMSCTNLFYWLPASFISLRLTVFELLRIYWTKKCWVEEKKEKLDRVDRPVGGPKRPTHCGSLQCGDTPLSIWSTLLLFDIYEHILNRRLFTLCQIRYLRDSILFLTQMKPYRCFFRHNLGKMFFSSQSCISSAIRCQSGHFEGYLAGTIQWSSSATRCISGAIRCFLSAFWCHSVHFRGHPVHFWCHPVP
jgi:hypothetical protein